MKFEIYNYLYPEIVSRMQFLRVNMGDLDKDKDRSFLAANWLHVQITHTDIAITN